MTAHVIDYQHGRDIPDEVFLAAVWKAGGEAGRWAMRWDVDRILGGFGPDDDLSEGVPGVPWKVSLQKARRLMKRGLLDGCSCGCRGDYELTDAGKARLFGEPVGRVYVQPRPDAYTVVTPGGGIGIAPKEAATDGLAGFPDGWVEVGYTTDVRQPTVHHEETSEPMRFGVNLTLTSRVDWATLSMLTGGPKLPGGSGLDQLLDSARLMQPDYRCSDSWRDAVAWPRAGGGASCSRCGRGVDSEVTMWDRDGVATVHFEPCGHGRKLAG